MKPLPALAIVLGVILIALAGYLAFTPAPTQELPEEPASQGKIDINAVCEGALAYMSFTDGASAEVFVQDCKEGKHPEVIEKYKADMNLGDGATI